MYALNCRVKDFVLSNGGSPRRGAFVCFATEVTLLNNACKNASARWNVQELMRNSQTTRSAGGYPTKKVGQSMPETLMTWNMKPYQLNLLVEER